MLVKYDLADSANHYRRNKMAIAATTESQEHSTAGVKIRRHTIAWTSDASGDVSESITNILSDKNQFQGLLVRVDFIPGSGGSQPSANYDVTITDENSVDILAGQGANRSNSATESVAPGLSLTDGTTTSLVPMPVLGSLTLTVENAGDTKTGTVILYER